MVYNDHPPAQPVPLPHPGKLLVIEPLDYANPYDYHKPHRHDYFEIILVRDGEGAQLIDFSEYSMQAGEMFTVYPGQVHLMQRRSAQGLLIQFRKDVFEFIQPLKHYQLYFPSPVFRPGPDVFSHVYDLAGRIRGLLATEELSSYAIVKAYSYLQIVLITFSELYGDKITIEGQHTVTRFLALLTAHSHTRKKVAEYCSMLGISTDKLNQACRKALGKTALELIHEELMLEIRRLLLLSELSLKEIAYELNFDSQANFSGFIKTQTGHTPSELQQAILRNYNL